MLLAPCLRAARPLSCSALAAEPDSARAVAASATAPRHVRIARAGPRIPASTVQFQDLEGPTEGREQGARRGGEVAISRFWFTPLDEVSRVNIGKLQPKRKHPSTPQRHAAMTHAHFRRITRLKLLVRFALPPAASTATACCTRLCVRLAVASLRCAMRSCTAATHMSRAASLSA